MKFEIHYYKTENLSPDERNAMRRNQSGLWLCGPVVEAQTAREACRLARQQYGYEKVRARR